MRRVGAPGGQGRGAGRGSSATLSPSRNTSAPAVPSMRTFPPSPADAERRFVSVSVSVSDHVNDRKTLLRWKNIESRKHTTAPTTLRCRAERWKERDEKGQSELL